MNHIANIYITIVLATMAGILYGVALPAAVNLVSDPTRLPWIVSLVGG